MTPTDDLKPCRSPYCECVAGRCVRTGFYDARVFNWPNSLDSRPAPMTKDKALDLALEALENNRRTHYYCEDTWYSCPKHEDGCANEAEGDECNCGADKANQEIDKAITAIKQARSAPVQEPVAKVDANDEGYWADILPDRTVKVGQFLYAAAQRQWVGLTEQELEAIWYRAETGGAMLLRFAKAIEAKLKEKNT